MSIERVPNVGESVYVFCFGKPIKRCVTHVTYTVLFNGELSSRHWNDQLVVGPVPPGSPEVNQVITVWHNGEPVQRTISSVEASVTVFGIEGAYHWSHLGAMQASLAKDYQPEDGILASLVG